MNVHLDSPCKQCHYFAICHTNRQVKRVEKQKEWIEAGRTVGMSTTDCFKSPQEHQRDIDNLPQWQKDELARCSEDLSCFSSYDDDNKQCRQCKIWSVCSKETAVKYDA